MKAIYGLVFSAAIVALSGCKQAPSQTEACLNLNVGVVVEIDSVRTDYPLRGWAMTIVNDTLILGNENEDAYFQTYELPSLRYIASGGMRGQGPGELVDPMIASMKPYFEGDFIVKSSTDFVFDVVEVATLTKIDQLSPKLPEGWSYVQDAFYVDKNLIAAENGLSPHIWAFFNQDGEIIKEFPQSIPDGVKALATDDFSKLLMDASFGALSSKEKVLAIGYRSFPLVEYYNFEGNLVGKLESHYVLGDRLDCWLGAMVATDDYLYIDFVNLTPDAKSSCTIVKTDWDGNVKASYLVDKLVFNVAVDEEHNKLFFRSTSVSDDDYIYFFEM